MTHMVQCLCPKLVLTCRSSPVNPSLFRPSGIGEAISLSPNRVVGYHLFDHCYPAAFITTGVEQGQRTGMILY